MALLETLIVGVGSGIAKGIVNLWFGEYPIGDELGKGVIDVVKKKTGDVLAQRSAGRQFEQISERVAQGVFKLIESQGALLGENEKLAVAKAAGTTINETPIDARLLAKHDLDPSLLVAHYHENNRFGKDGLSDEQAALYDRIVSDAAQYITDIASQMPSFTERTLAEVLRRETELIERSDRILEEVQKIREGTEDEDAKSAAFEAEYRRAVVRRLDRIELFGVDLSEASKRYKLSVAYITLALQREGPPGDEAIRGSRAPDPHEDAEEDDDRTEIVPADSAVTESKRLFVRGAAGSGKTTLMQWVAVRAALRDLETLNDDWDDKVPFFIRLRQFTGKDLPNPETFPALVAPNIAATMPNEWVHEQLNQGRGVVLVDGVDEVTEQQQDEVRDWLRDLVGAFPSARVIVTSRPHAADEGWLADCEFTDAELQDMDAGDIDSFIAHWHEAVRQEVRGAEERQALNDLEQNLTAAMKKSRPIRRLATNPLLCAMLCALHRDRVQNLPSDRIELYHACCEMFLRRDRERRIDLTDYPEMGSREKLTLLQDFAYWLIKNGWSQVNKTQADGRFQTALERLKEPPKRAMGEDIRRLFVHRSGFLRHPTANSVDFTHRTFQEYLAAHAAIEEGDLGLLVENAHLDQWRQVLILAAGVARPNEAKKLIDGLIHRGDREKKRRHQLHLLAVACLETPVKLDSSIANSVQKRLAAIVPPQNLTDAKALALAGDLVVPYLAYDKSRRGPEVAASVRTLAMVGGNEALNTLVDYVSDRRRVVIRELVNSRDWTDASDDFSKRIIHPLNEQTIRYAMADHYERDHGSERHKRLIVYSPGVTDLAPLARLLDLSALEIHYCEHLYDVSPLTQVKRLTSLRLFACLRLSDISALSSLTKLTTIRLDDCHRIVDLSPLAPLDKLSNLILIGCCAVSDISPLGALADMKKLTLYGGRRITDLSPLRSLTKLKSLELDECTGVTDLSPLANLIKLTSLDLSGCKKVEDLTPLKRLPDLKDLNILSCVSLADLRPLLEMENLQRVSWDGDKSSVPAELRARIVFCPF